MNWELGEPKVYIPGDVPLAESTVWPDDLTDWEAERFAARVEELGNARLGAVACPGDHGLFTDPWPIQVCDFCRAAL